MSIRFGGGQYFNIAKRAAAINGLTVTDEDSKFPKAGAIDNAGNPPFRFNTAGASNRLDFDLNHLLNGGFETAFVGGVPAAAVSPYLSWVTTGATATRNTSTPKTGVACMQVSGTGYIYADILVLAGEFWHGEGWGRKQGAGTNALIRAQNLHTGSWLKSDGTWQSAAQALLDTSSTSYVSWTVATTIESPTTSMPRKMTLRVYYYGGGSGGAGTETLYDETFWWPYGVNQVSIHGHNIVSNLPSDVNQGVTVELLGAGTATPTNVRASLTQRRPSFYKNFTATEADRFLGVKITNSSLNPSGAVFIGELLLIQAVTLLRSQNYGYRITAIDPQLIEATDAGEQRRYLECEEGGRRRLKMTVGYRAAAQYAEARDVMMQATRNGAYKSVLVPDDTDPEVCIFGNLQPMSAEWEHSREGLNLWEGSEIVIDEAPMFTVVP
jgi:hypothetical protein